MSCRTIGFAIGLLLSAVAFAPPAQTSRVPTVTRLVKIFSGLESGLVAQAHSSDAAALEQSLDPSFEMRIGAEPGTPIPRDEWIRHARAAKDQNSRIEQMAVHDFGEVAIVSFRQSVSGGSKGGGGANRFIVDCWKRAGDGWKLAVRYLSDASSRGVAATGSAKTIDKRY